MKSAFTRNIVIIGSGNLATHIALALYDAGHVISQVYSRSLSNAKALAERVGSRAVASLKDVTPDAQIYVIAVKDDAIPSVVKGLSHVSQNAVLIHTAGTVSITLLAGRKRYGVLYPMQTFTKTLDIEFSEIPCFIEASEPAVLHEIRCLAESISHRVTEADSTKRKKLHLAAVFACNMVNHCYRLAEEILAEENLDFSLLFPLIKETSRKVQKMSPKEAQTGPMRRGDKTVMEAQKSLLHDDDMLRLYDLMAESISQRYKSAKNPLINQKTTQ